MTSPRTLLAANALCLAAAILAGCGSSGGGDAPVAPAGTGTGTTYPPATISALMDPGEAPASMSQFAALSTVDALAYRARWRDLEPTEGNYDWTSLDAAFDAVRNNKRLTVHIGVSGGAWPNWLAGRGAVTYNYVGPHGQVTDPLPWDAVFLARYDAFVAALAAHLHTRGDIGLLHAITVGAPVSEMSLVGCQNNTLGGFAYNRASYLSAWAAAIGSHRNRFDSAAIWVSAPVSVICRPDNDGASFYSAVMTADPSRPLGIFAADLNAAGSSRVAQLDASLKQQLAINLQTTWSATNDPTNRMAGSLQEAVCQGLRLGTRYFEIYKSDLLSTDPAIRAAIDTARTGSGCP